MQNTDKVQICCIDFQNSQPLKDAGYDVFDGTWLTPGYTKPHLPKNLQEYEFVIMDLTNDKYKENCKFSEFIGIKFNDFFDKKIILIFSGEFVNIEIDKKIYSEFDFLNKLLYGNIFVSKQTTGSSWSGKKMSVTGEELFNITATINKHKDNEDCYEEVFTFSTLNDCVPLMVNINNQIVSFGTRGGQYGNFDIIILPNLKNKTAFLLDFLKECAPLIAPTLFPNATQFSWIKNKEYLLPNHQSLLAEKEKLEEKYLQDLAAQEAKIQKNDEEHAFLREMLTGTGEPLTNAIIQYLEWLGFINPINYDNDPSKKSKILEEDIQIQLPNNGGLLVIETKGIASKSKDEDCSQINKIKHRRIEDKIYLDVFALYIVNHQRYIEPSKRENPPFTPEQIKDALLQKRGLLTTWQLFQLFSKIEKGVITKDEARARLLDFGLIDFNKNLVNLGSPKGMYQKNTVCILDLKDITVSVGDKLYFENETDWRVVEIQSIQLDGKDVATASNGEVGLQLSNAIPPKCNLWKIMG